MVSIKKRLLAGLFFAGVASCAAEGVTVRSDFSASPAIVYAEAELGRWIDSLERIAPPARRPKFTFRHQPAYAETGTFAYACNRRGDVTFTAGDPAGILAAVYTCLEDLGILYDVTGATLPDAVRWDDMRGTRREVTPRVRWRGIRQHVNFPMDISSYPIGQAVEYLQNLVRMRFNKLVVHSYPYQWYEDDISTDTTGWAGQFFYGHTHDFGRSPLLQSVATLNDSIFCIPAAEKVFHDRKARSRVAVEWMGQLLTAAKELGLRVQFSFEPRGFTVNQTVRMARKLTETYPQIDDLELITEETGGWGASCTGDEVRQTLRRWFGEAALADTLVTRCIADRQNDLEYLFRQIGTIKESILALEQDPAFRAGKRGLKLGIYCSVGKFMGPAYRLACQALPSHSVAIMPSHGSAGTAAAFPAVVRTSDELARTELYSWIEFDGLMYLQQNAIDGIGRLLCDMDTLAGGGQLNSVCFNHWRTAENRAAFRYAAESTLGGAVSPDSFYAGYAARLGIGDTASYAGAMRLIDEADRYATARLGNIGFCWVGAWRDGGPFLWMGPQQIDHADSLYLRAGEITAGLYRQNSDPAAQRYLGLLGNRLLTSVLYLKAFRQATGLRTIRKNPDGTVPSAEQKRAAEICDKALASFEDYIRTYARLMPDRGCEGTAMSIWFSPMQGLRRLRSTLGGVPVDEPLHGDMPQDAPPLPIFYEQGRTDTAE